MFHHPVHPRNHKNGWLQVDNLYSQSGTKSISSTDAYYSYIFYDETHPTEFFFIKPYVKELTYCSKIPDEGMTIWRINTAGNNSQYPNKIVRAFIWQLYLLTYRAHKFL